MSFNFGGSAQDPGFRRIPGVHYAGDQSVFSGIRGFNPAFVAPSGNTPWDQQLQNLQNTGAKTPSLPQDSSSGAMSNAGDAVVKYQTKGKAGLAPTGQPPTGAK